MSFNLKEILLFYSSKAKIIVKLLLQNAIFLYASLPNNETSMINKIHSVREFVIVNDEKKFSFSCFVKLNSFESDFSHHLR